MPEKWLAMRFSSISTAELTPWNGSITPIYHLKSILNRVGCHFFSISCKCRYITHYIRNFISYIKSLLIPSNFKIRIIVEWFNKNLFHIFYWISEFIYIYIRHLIFAHSKSTEICMFSTRFNTTSVKL